MIKVKAVCSIKKIFLQSDFHSFEEITTIKCAKGERVSFQLAIKNVVKRRRKAYATFEVNDEFKKYTELYEVGHVPVRYTEYEGMDDYFLSKTPGLYPDVLYPLTESTEVLCEISNINSVWVTVSLPTRIKAGKHELKITVTGIDKEVTKKQVVTVVLDVKNTVMPKNDLIYTQWLHCDCIADYYNVPMMSKKHWRYIEQFIKTAAKTGITMLLTPLFTPPLDTMVGGERPTMQLVGVSTNGDKYSFDFTELDRWVALCRKYGIEYFELSHLFTQWGAGFCPKIIVDGKKEFGWEVKSTDPKYRSFLKQFLPCLTSHLKELGIADKCYFHISDEPHMKGDRPDFENYKAAYELIKPYIDGFKNMDAISDIDFYESGMVEVPVPFIGHIEPFLERDIKERWCYYCSSNVHHLPDRFIAFPSSRTRVLGTLLFMYDMAGFLQWGFNFYYVDYSRHKIDPYLVTDGECTWPAGNAFSVYPDKNGGAALESIRTKVFYEAIQDRMLLKALADKVGTNRAKEIVNEVAGGKINGFLDYPTDDGFLPRLHDTILDILG